MPIRHRLTNNGNLQTNTFLDSIGVTNPRFARDSIIGVLDERTLKSNSLYFDGSGDFIQITNNSLLELSSGDFTIEAWIYYDNSAVQGRRIIGKGDTVLSNMEYFFQINNAYALVFSYSLNGTTSNPLGSSGLTVSTWLNKWNHVAATRSGNTIRTFLNGVNVASATVTSNFYVGTSDIFIGSTPIGTNYWSGNISNLRVIKGQALYTSNFTPPKQALETNSNTSLLMSCLLGEPFVDSSSNRLTLTPNGNTSANTSSPFQTESSMRLDKDGLIFIKGEYSEIDSVA